MQKLLLPKKVALTKQMVKLLKVITYSCVSRQSRLRKQILDPDRSIKIPIIHKNYYAEKTAGRS
jgi:hypothetical protein